MKFLEKFSIETNSKKISRFIIDKQTAERLHDQIEMEIQEILSNIQERSKFLKLIQSNKKEIRQLIKDGHELSDLESLKESLIRSEGDSVDIEGLDMEDLDMEASVPISRGFHISMSSWLRKIQEKYADLEKTKKLIRALSRQITFLLNKIKKSLRNLREVYTTHHSFHFKNLDDYHSTNLNLSF